MAKEGNFLVQRVLVGSLLAMSMLLWFLFHHAGRVVGWVVLAAVLCPFLALLTSVDDPLPPWRRCHLCVVVKVTSPLRHSMSLIGSIVCWFNGVEDVRQS